ncbi:MAG TPA: hypothetical protein VGK67_26645 [Myxococcales bacterium]
MARALAGCAALPLTKEVAADVVRAAKVGGDKPLLYMFQVGDVTAHAFRTGAPADAPVALADLTREAPRNRALVDVLATEVLPDKVSPRPPGQPEAGAARGQGHLSLEVGAHRDGPALHEARLADGTGVGEGARATGP